LQNQIKEEINLLSRLLNIKSDSSKILLLLYPPIYALWLLAIGKHLLLKQNKANNLYMFFASTNVMLFAMAFFIAPILKLVNIDISLTGARAYPVLFVVYFFWFGTTGMLTKLTINYERSQNPDHYYRIVDILDYVKRFLAFFYWPFSIWSYQRRVNKYMEMTS
jgi:hypothetical protein